MDIQTTGLKFAKPKQRSTPISPNLMEIPVHTILEPHLTLQIDNHDSPINTDEDAHEKPSGSSVDKDIERGE